MTQTAGRLHPSLRHAHGAARRRWLSTASQTSLKITLSYLLLVNSPPSSSAQGIAALENEKPAIHRAEPCLRPQPFFQHLLPSVPTSPFPCPLQQPVTIAPAWEFCNSSSTYSLRSTNARLLDNSHLATSYCRCSRAPAIGLQHGLP
jgi:hypothetical protein